MPSPVYLRERSHLPHRIGISATQSALVSLSRFDPALPRAGQGSLRDLKTGGFRGRSVRRSASGWGRWGRGQGASRQSAQGRRGSQEDKPDDLSRCQRHDPQEVGTAGTANATNPPEPANLRSESAPARQVTEPGATEAT